MGLGEYTACIMELWKREWASFFFFMIVLVFGYELWHPLTTVQYGLATEWNVFQYFLTVDPDALLYCFEFRRGCSSPTHALVPDVLSTLIGSTNPNPGSSTRRCSWQRAGVLQDCGCGIPRRKLDEGGDGDGLGLGKNCPGSGYDILSVSFLLSLRLRRNEGS